MIRNEVTDESINGVDREIKIFLTYLHLVQNNIENDKINKKTKSYWLSRCNHLYLFNIPIHMRHICPMINLWDQN